LTKFVFAVLPSYAMKATFLPRHIYDTLDGKYIDFLWGDTNDHKTIQPFTWLPGPKFVNPGKDNGGLGLCNAWHINSLFHAKELLVVM